MERLTPQLVPDDLVELGTALMSAGSPTHRLELLRPAHLVRRGRGRMAKSGDVHTKVRSGALTPRVLVALCSPSVFAIASELAIFHRASSTASPSPKRPSSL